MNLSIIAVRHNRELGWHTQIPGILWFTGLPGKYVLQCIPVQFLFFAVTVELMIATSRQDVVKDSIKAGTSVLTFALLGVHSKIALQSLQDRTIPKVTRQMRTASSISILAIH